MSTFKVTFAGGAQMATGSNFLLEFGGKKVLIDCGLVQGERNALSINHADFTFTPSEVDMLIVTHAHLDHVGKIPKLVRDGFRGVIVSTEPTREMAELVMLDSMGILAKEGEHEGFPPLYEDKDVFEAVHLWSKIVTYDTSFDFETTDGTATVTLRDAGHILGSSIVEIAYKGKTIAFTGDLGNTPSPLMKDTEPLHGVDYLIIESVYGDRNHKDKDVRLELLKEAIVSTTQKGGTVLIPAFSIERTQEILLAFNELFEKQHIPEVPVYLDSPLGINITKVYTKYDTWFNETIEKAIKAGDDIFSFKNLIKTVSPEESKDIVNDPRPKVIIAGSGMSVGGRIVHHEAHYLSDPRNTIVVAGYQASNSLGRKIVDGEKEVIIYGQVVPVRARVVNIRGFSAHKDSDHLVEFVGTTKESLKKVIVVLGEPKSTYFLGQRIHEEYGVPVAVPEKNDILELP
jgi:metallo-beta-lactamase family protein